MYVWLSNTVIALSKKIIMSAHEDPLSFLFNSGDWSTDAEDYEPSEEEEIDVDTQQNSTQDKIESNIDEMAVGDDSAQSKHQDVIAQRTR